MGAKIKKGVCSVREFRALSAIAVSCIVEAIRDAAYADPEYKRKFGQKGFRISKIDIVSARSFLHNDDHECVLDLKKCCEIISYFLQLHGYRLQIEPKEIRQWLQEHPPEFVIEQLEMVTKASRESFPGETGDPTEDEQASAKRTYRVAA